MNKDVIVAVDLGSSSIKAMAAERVDADTLRILGLETSSRYPCVSKGAVVQSSHAGFTIRELIRLLANRTGTEEMSQVFVVNGGRSMQLVSLSWKRDLIRKTEVTTAILDDMERECKEWIESQNPQASVLCLVPVTYSLDHKLQTDRPEETQKAVLLEIFYSVFVGKQELGVKVQDSFDHAFKVIEKQFARPDAQLSAFILGKEEVLERGCAVVDMGAQTTTVSVYKGNQYLTCKVIPIGGWHITRLIEQQGIDPRYAEFMKTRYGYAMPELVEEDATMKIPSTEEDTTIRVRITELAEVIQMKLDEIMAAVMEVLSPFEERIETLFLTGGASQMYGMPEYVETKTKLQVEYGNFAPLLAAGTPKEYYSPQYSSLVGALILGSDYRTLHPQQNINKEKKTIRQRLKEWKESIEEQAVIVFTPNDEKNQ